MPIPKPNKNETKNKFIERCMGDDKMNTEYPDAETDLFLKAKACVLRRECVDASTELEKYLKEYPKGKYNDEVLYWLAKSNNALSEN